MKTKKQFLAAIAAAFFFLCFTGLVEGYQNMPIAEVSVGSFGINFKPNVSYEKAIIAVSCPDGQVYYKAFTAGTAPYLGLSDSGWTFSDGPYTFELRLIPHIEKRVRKVGVSTIPINEPMVLSGHFTISGGSIMPVGLPEGSPARPLDALHYDDVIITGSLCVGFDCVNGESFGYCTIKLKENNLQLCFEDTSVGSFPTNDWKIQINDSTSGGASYFTIWDTDGGRRPFTIEAGAPAHSLYVEDYGRIGLGTSVPYVELHIVDGDTPTIRLDQDGSSGWAAQRWDLAGNETNFFLRDVTNGSKLCFRVQPNTPSNTLCMRSTGYVGVGTWSPEYPLEVETTGSAATFVAQQTDGATAVVSAGGSYVFIGAKSNHDFRLLVNDSPKMVINTSGWVGISDTSPDYPLDMGTIAPGAYCTTTGVWHDSSSLEYKENIRDLGKEEAIAAFNKLNPVKYNYKVDKEDEYVGFIAEHVPDLVASKDRKGMSSMNIVGVLTKVLQEQQKTIAELKQEVAELRNNYEKK